MVQVPKWQREIEEILGKSSLEATEQLASQLQQFSTSAKYYVDNFWQMWKGWNIDEGDYELQQFYRATSNEASQLVESAQSLLDRLVPANTPLQTPALPMKRILSYLTSVENLLACFRMMQLRIDTAVLREERAVVEALETRVRNHILSSYDANSKHDWYNV